MQSDTSSSGKDTADVSNSLYALFEFLLPKFQRKANKLRYSRNTRLLLDALLLQAKYGNFDSSSSLPNKLFRPYKNKVYTYWRDELLDHSISECIRSFVMKLTPFHEKDVQSFLEERGLENLSHEEIDMIDDEVEKKHEKELEESKVVTSLRNLNWSVRSSMRMGTQISTRNNAEVNNAKAPAKKTSASPPTVSRHSL